VASGSRHDDPAVGRTDRGQSVRERAGSAANGRAPRRQPVLRGRPRDAAFDGRILEAALDELASGGISHFSVSAVARRAGVAKGSIYLRWPDREQLMLDAAELVIRPITPPNPGSFRKQLAELAAHFAHLFEDPRNLELTLRIDADRYRHLELFAKMYKRMQAAANLIVERTVIEAQHRGEIDPAVHPQVVTRMLTGSMFVEALAHWPEGGVSEQFRRELVNFIADRLELPAGRPPVTTAHE
jgi:AcrR family transcriptional regulator